MEGRVQETGSNKKLLLVTYSIWSCLRPRPPPITPSQTLSLTKVELIRAGYRHPQAPSSRALRFNARFNCKM